MWLDLWRGSDEVRQIAAATWEFWLQKLRKAGRKRWWHEARGPVAGVISMLLSNDWDPQTSTLWISLDGTEWGLTTDPADFANIESQVMKLLWRRQWTAAAKARHGVGVDEGVVLAPLKRQLARFRRNGDFEQAAILEAAACTSLWPAERLYQAGYALTDDERLCPLCHGALDTEEHRIWCCPVVCESQHLAVKATNHMCQRATAGMPVYPCLWLRGIVPLCMFDIEEPPDVVPVWLLGEAKHLQWPWNVEGSTIFLDESAGSHSGSPILRRAGWGLAVINDDLSLRAGVYAPLGGKQQTQIRAGLSALVFIAEETSGEVCVKPDCQYLIDGVNSGRFGTLGWGEDKRHVDLWQRFWNACVSRHGAVNLVKVTAHQDIEEALIEEVDPVDWVGNNLG